jgi:hypothetical protein
VKSFNIQIPNDKAATYRLVTLITAIINLLAFGFFMLNINAGSLKMIAITGFISGVLSVILLGVKKYTSYLSNFRIETLFTVCSACWIITGNYLLGSLLMVFTLLGFIALKRKVIYFYKEGIRYPSFPTRLISWKGVDFVMLKDDILTIEMKNNKLIQFTLEKDIASMIDTDDFNNFCSEQLTP